MLEYYPFAAFIHVKGRLTTRLLLCLCVQIVGVTSPCLDADSSDARLRQTSAVALREELEWGIHLGLQACILPLPRRLGNANFAHVINQVSILLLLGCVLLPSDHDSAIQDASGMSLCMLFWFMSPLLITTFEKVQLTFVLCMLACKGCLTAANTSVNLQISYNNIQMQCFQKQTFHQYLPQTHQSRHTNTKAVNRLLNVCST